MLAAGWVEVFKREYCFFAGKIAISSPGNVIIIIIVVVRRRRRRRRRMGGRRFCCHPLPNQSIRPASSPDTFLNLRTTDLSLAIQRSPPPPHNRCSITSSHTPQPPALLQARARTITTTTTNPSRFPPDTIARPPDTLRMKNNTKKRE